MYAVVDCNCFFVSCERVFRPDLNDKPVIVLSNNDGCAVSRSPEAKSLIPMGGPYWKYRDVLDKHGVQSFSANFALYGDMSRRVMDVLSYFAPDIEPYSIDEAFINLKQLGIKDYQDWGEAVAKRVMQWTGVSVAVGVGSTKTRAKAAVTLAKNQRQSALYLDSDDLLKNLSVDEVWGVGRRLAPRLERMGVRSAFDIIAISQAKAQEFAGITFVRTASELKGVDCFGGRVQFNEPSKHTLLVSRSFGKTTHSLSTLELAIASFSARAAHRLRRQSRVANEVSVFIQTGKHSKHQHQASSRVPLPYSTADTGSIMTAALKALKQTYSDDFGYKRAGVLLTGIQHKSDQQLSLIEQVTEEDMGKKEGLVSALDALHHKWGRGVVRYGAEGFSKRWHSLRERPNPAYTTNWRQIPRVLVG